MKFLYQLFFFLSLLQVSLTAEIVSIRTLAIDDINEMPARYVLTEAGYQPLSVSSRQISLPKDALWEKDADLPIYETVKTPENGLEYRIKEKIPLPRNAREILIVISGSGDAHQYWALNDPFKKATHNDWLFINASAMEVKFSVGADKEPFSIGARSGRNCSVNQPSGRGVAVKGQAIWDDTEKTFYSTYWPVREGERAVVVFTDEGDRIQVRKISDRLTGE